MRSESPPVDRDVNVNGRRGVLTPRVNQVNVEESPSNNQGQEEVPGAGCSKSNTHQPSSSESRPNSFERNRQPPYSINRNINLPTNNNMAAFRASPPSTGNRHRERQLEALHRMEERYKNLSRNTQQQQPPRGVPESPPQQSPVRYPPQQMSMFVMDISSVLIDHSVKWLPIKSVSINGPEHTILYSLVAGQGEIIMFGGIQRDVNFFGHGHESMNVINTVTNTIHFITAPQNVV